MVLGNIHFMCEKRLKGLLLYSIYSHEGGVTDFVSRSLFYHKYVSLIPMALPAATAINPEATSLE
jgi:hypothetical protein